MRFGLKYLIVALVMAFSLNACTSEDSNSLSSGTDDSLSSRGIQGPVGPQGAQGPQGPAGSFHAFNEPVAISNATLATLENEARTVSSPSGWMNPSSTNFIYVSGSVLFLHVNPNSVSPGGCKSASVEVQWTSGGAWKVIQSLFFEAYPRTGTIGDGYRFPINLVLPPSGKFRVVDNANPDCMSGDLDLGRHPTTQRPHANAGWFYSIMQ